MILQWFDRGALLLERMQAMRLIRWGIGYIAIAWLVLQAAVLLADVYQSGPTVKRTTVALLAGGFPAALFIAWAIDSRSRLRLPAAIIGIALSALLSVLLYQQLDRRSVPTTATLLVLTPIDLRAPMAQSDELGSRIHEALLDELAGDRVLKALSRSVAGSFAPQHSSPAEFALGQGATHFVEISIKDTSTSAAEPMLEVTAQLIDATEGTHVASYTKTYRAVSSLGVERDLATLLAGAFRVQLGPEDWASLGEVRTNSEAARQLFKQAEVNIRYGLGQDYERSYDEALLLDPGFAQSAARQSLMRQGSDDATVRAEERRVLAERFGDDPDFMFFSTGMFGVVATANAEWEKRFVNDPVFLYREAVVTMISETRWEEPARDLRTGAPVIPRTVAAVQRAIAADPSFYWPRELLAGVYFRLGAFTAADQVLVELERRFPRTGQDWELYRIQSRLAASGDIAELRDRVASYTALNRPTPTPGRRVNLQLLETELALAHLSGDIKAAMAHADEFGDAPLTGLAPDWGPLLQRRWTGADEAAVDAFLLGDRKRAAAHATNKLMALDAKLRNDGLDPGADKGLPWMSVQDRTFWRFIVDPRSVTANDLKRLEERMHYNKKLMGTPIRLAFMYAWSDEPARATHWLEQCLLRVMWCNPKLVARDPWWAPLYGYAPFEQLVLGKGGVLVRHKTVSVNNR